MTIQPTVTQEQLKVAYLKTTQRSIDHVLDAVLGPRTEGHAAWALLDFPEHSNVGDAAIWLGTLALLGPRFGGPPGYVTSHKAFPSDLDRLSPQGPVLMHGGGNFGDLWPGFWQNRVAILERYRHRKIVQMPQSIYFSKTGDALAQTQRSIAAHPDFTLLVRDAASLAFAQLHFDCPVYLCPDMAFGLGPLAARQQPSVAIFALMREDDECGDDGAAPAILPHVGRMGDWVSAQRLAVPGKTISRLTQKVPALRRPLMQRLERAYRQQAQWQVQRGCDLLGQGESVITDRLHAHILCTLMGKRHIVLDNNYGKISGYIRSWPEDGLTHLAADRDAALRDLAKIS